MGEDEIRAGSFEIAEPPVSYAIPPWLKSHCADSAAVAKFAHEQNILDDLKTALDIANSTFGGSGTKVYLDQDPEDEGEWLVINIAASGQADEFLKTYDRCIDAWLASIPRRAMSLIRLSYRFN
jgi:hypothetical protein